MSIPDGEYDIDLSVLNQSVVDTFGIRYGTLPSDIDQEKPIKLYDDSKNLILEVKDKRDELIVFEGVSQVNNSKNPVMSNYFFTLENNIIKLGKLNKTIRVNKSRNSIKWNNLIRKWNNELESQNIISESDFENFEEFPDFQLEFEDNEVDLGIDKGESNNSTILKENKTLEILEKGKLDNEASDRERIEKENIKKQILDKDKRQREQKERFEKDRQQKENIRLEEERQQQKVELKRQKTMVQPQKINPSATSNPRRGASGKSISSKPAAEKKPTKQSDKASTMEDDFQDLEDQLQEVLGDNDDSESESEYSDVFTGGPITIIENKSNNVNNQNSVSSSRVASKRPMSLRSLMGERENEDGSSSEEE